MGKRVMSAIIFCAFVAAIAVANMTLGYRWSRLDHNPWRDSFAGGMFRTPAPGLIPARLSVETIRSRGRTLMVTFPICGTLFVIFIIVSKVISE